MAILIKAFEWFVALFGAVWPPAAGEDPLPWRRAVFSILMLIVAVLTFHVLAVKGHMGFIGVPRMAHAGEVQVVDDRSKALLRAIYAPQIRAKVRERCDTNDAKKKEVINRDLDFLLREYQEAAGKEFKMPTCEEV